PVALAQQSDDLFGVVSFLLHFEDLISFKSSHSLWASPIGGGHPVPPVEDRPFFCNRRWR
ncbi:MAG: hypothetical protein AB7P49_14555, partial [Bdellovibrionales bacterium]